jgi:hypothetical protein
MAWKDMGHAAILSCPIYPSINQEIHVICDPRQID